MNHQHRNGKDARRRILEAIDTLTAQYGIPPTMREVMEVTGFTSTGHVWYHLDRLRRDGRLDRSFAGRSRGLVRSGSTSRSRDAVIDECMVELDQVASYPFSVVSTWGASSTLRIAKQRLMSLKGRRR